MPNSSQHKAERQAIQWQARLSSDLLSDRDRREFDDWLTASPENAMAWQTINAFWKGLDNFDLADITDGATTRILKFGGRETGKPKRAFPRSAFALAASLLLTLSLAYRQFDYYLADYRTNTGEQREISLADGSAIRLNTDSAVSVSFSAPQRLITLHRGEAFFKVAKDNSRPFIVQTEAGRVQALGTQFDVRLMAKDKVGVTVFEHAVKITNNAGQSLEKLGKAERMTFSPQALGASAPVNLLHAAAWRMQTLMFQDKPLAEVIAELDRYRPGKILIISDAIRNLPITGVFDTSDPDIALQSIAQSLPVQVNKITGHLALLSAK